MKVRVMAGVFGLTVLGSVSSSPDAAAGREIVLRFGLAVAAADQGGQCVGFDKSDGDKTILYEVENSCEKKQACSISWLVTCEDEAGKVTTRSQKSSRFALKPEAKHSVSLSAESCKQGWRIENVSWQCDDAK
jgi:hypothetical protein